MAKLGTALDEKQCSSVQGCGLIRPLEAFSRNSAAPDGRMPLCKECQRRKHRNYRARYASRNALVDPREVTTEKCCRCCFVTKPTTEFSLNRERRDGLHNWCRSCHAVYRTAHHARKTVAEKRALVLARRSLTVADYDRLLAEQGGGCAICGTTEPAGKSKTYFAVDHDHATGVVRGLLCGHCNVMLGNAKDDPSTLRAGASYLERGL